MQRLNREFLYWKCEGDKKKNIGHLKGDEEKRETMRITLVELNSMYAYIAGKTTY